MRKILLSLLLIAVAYPCFPQFGGKDIAEYKASNGITYKVGDEIKLGVGSAPNGSFNFISMRGVFMDADYSSRNNLNKMFAGKVAKIDKIKSLKDGEQIYFVVGGLTLSKWALMIEEAIIKCEVADCKKKGDKVAVPDKYDKLKKLKELLDSGAITQDEYEKEKKKILEEN